jgi:hypothetical protein
LSKEVKSKLKELDKVQKERAKYGGEMSQSVGTSVYLPGLESSKGGGGGDNSDDSDDSDV